MKLRGWVLWLIVLAALTAGMFVARDHLNEAHIALAYLLVVLAGSSQHGGRLGILLSAFAFFFFDWFFLPPYGTLIISKSVDWAVLLAFLLTSVVAARLFARVRLETEAATDRAREVDHLASIGAETLNAGRAEDALTAIATVISEALDLTGCSIYMRDEKGVRLMYTNVNRNEKGRVGYSELIQRAVNSTATIAIRSNGIVDEISLTGRDESGWSIDSDRSEVLIALSTRDRTVGVLAIARDGGLLLTPQQLRFLSALSYYAALGLERVRLVSEAQSADALRESSRLKDAVVASVSHDLRTPLTTIKALAAEIAAAGDERATTIEDEADRLNAMVTDLLDIARLNSGTTSLNLEPNEAEDLVGAALQRVQGMQGLREIRVSLEPGDPLLIGRFDFAQTLRALVNLLENALRYSPSSEPIELRVRRDDAWLAFSVLDRGAGVPVSEQDRIFEPFYRPPGSAPDTGGAGLGLSIARALALAEDGSLTHTDRDGGGSVFTLRVPGIDLVELSGS